MNLRLKDLPSVNQVLLEINNDIRLHSSYLKFIINRILSHYRSLIKTGAIKKSKDELFQLIISEVFKESKPKLVNVINGTGIVLHTGFGRAPFDKNKLKNLAERLDGYVNLEFDLISGKRGERQSHVKDQISAICGSESAIMVNNNAAAIYLTLNSISEGGEVICSRGQLVEIGGSFRIPDIVSKSGSILKGVGTTNRTHLKDYKNAISKKTRLILWVHTSNYVVKGFTRDVSLGDLVKLGKKHQIPVLADLGSGSLLNLAKLGLSDEIPIKSIMKSDPDILTFSGDKLLGGPQSGLIIGKEKWIKSLQKNSLYRVLRCDKITIGLMEETLRSYRAEYFTKDNFSLKMLTSSRRVLKSRALKIINSLRPRLKIELGITIIESFVEAGSGSLPEKNIPSIALQFKPKSLKVTDLAKSFRKGSIPVVGYISSDKYYIDLKSVLPSQIKKLTSAISDK